ncbi:ERC protein 2 [Microtus ochrogaster]|uniref:ERC protein 2 n=1 Tax=Microtus ochrogaster TaxID=79684 RepID=A0A8J6GQ01_MICOH|nr:ERC protein 2 [Microtus ochrogaster]
MVRAGMWRPEGLDKCLAMPLVKLNELEQLALICVYILILHVEIVTHLQLTIQALQDELRTQRDLNHLLQQERGNRGAEHFTIELTEENFRRLQAEHDRQAKELFLLRKTLEEMELRIETQKQTLNARDESIKKLLEMLQSKGLPSKSLEDDSERTRRMAEAESQVSHLEVILDQKEKENIHLREAESQTTLRGAGDSSNSSNNNKMNVVTSAYVKRSNQCQERRLTCEGPAETQYYSPRHPCFATQAD